MEHIHELLSIEKIKIFQRDDMFSFSLDSMLIADFVNTEKAKKIIDLGTGNAPIPLYLTQRTKAIIYGIEIQKEVYELAQKSVEINKLNDQIKVLNENILDINKILGLNEFDIVITNPPFFKYNENSNVNKNEYLTIARHEVLITLEQIINESKKLLKDGGKLYMIHRIERLPEAITLLEAQNFGIKKIRFVYAKTSDKEANCFMLEAKKNKKSALKVLEPLYVYDESEYTKEAKRIFSGKNNY